MGNDQKESIMYIETLIFFAVIAAVFALFFTFVSKASKPKS